MAKRERAPQVVPKATQHATRVAVTGRGGRRATAAKTHTEGESDLPARFYEAFIGSDGAAPHAQVSERRKALALMQRIASDIRLLAAHSAERFGIHVTDFYILLLLYRAGPGCTLPVGSLQKSLGFTSGGMTRRLDRMEQAELIERVHDPTDRRAWQARLTRSGRALAAKIRLARASQLQDAYRELSDAEWRTLAELLARIGSRLDELART
jgi:DNA-binding MarR family transcriptional regulator